MDVIITGSGVNSDVEQQIDRTHLSGRVTIRPLEHKIGLVTGGHFAATAITGTIAAGIAANAQILQIRWADPTKIFLLKKITAQGATSTIFTTLFGADLELIVGHNSTANGSGGTALALNSTSNRLNSKTMAPSGFAGSGEIRIATTAALTAATGQVLEPAGIGYGRAAPFAANTTLPKFSLFDRVDPTAHPLVLQLGDTLVVRTPNPGASGVWSVGFEIEWIEVVDY